MLRRNLREANAAASAHPLVDAAALAMRQHAKRMDAMVGRARGKLMSMPGGISSPPAYVSQ